MNDVAISLNLWLACNKNSSNESSKGCGFSSEELLLCLVLPVSIWAYYAVKEKSASSLGLMNH